MWSSLKNITSSAWLVIGLVAVILVLVAYNTGIRTGLKAGKEETNNNKNLKQ